MNKRFKACLSLMLAVVMVAAMAVPAYAATTENVKKYQSLCVIGDSTASGYRINNLNYSDTENWWNRGAPKAYYGVASNAFPGLLRDALGAEYYSMTAVAQRLIDALWVLGGYEDEYSIEEMEKYVQKGGIESLWPNVKRMHDTGEGMNNIRRASLVVIQIGANDIFGKPVDDATVNGQLDLTLLPDALEIGYERFLTLYPKLIERIYELNPYATIVICSQYNPYENISIVTDSGTITGDMMSVYIDYMNTKLEEFAWWYGCTYVDVTEVETLFDEVEIDGYENLDQLGGNNYDNHPPEEGHQMIANAVLAALPTAEKSTTYPQSGINHLVFNGEDMGNYIIRSSGLGYTIRDLNGNYVCFDSDSKNIVLRSSNPTVWSYLSSTGFTTTYTVTTTSRFLFWTTTTTSNVTAYLSAANGQLSRADSRVSTNIYVAN